MRVGNRILAVATAVALCAIAVASASAQQSQAELQSWQVPGWSFTPGIAIGPMFDSNVALAGPDEFGETASDTLMQVEPFGQLEYFNARRSRAAIGERCAGKRRAERT